MRGLWMLGLGLIMSLTWAQQKEICPKSNLELRPSQLPKGVRLQPILRDVNLDGQFDPAGASNVRALLYEATDITGFYLPTTDEICEDVPLLGSACIHRVAIGYYAPDIDGDGTSSPVVGLTLSFRSWNGQECSAAGASIRTLNISGLSDNGAWLLLVNIDPPVAVSGSFYLCTTWNDNRVGWIIVDGRPGNALHDRSLNSFWDVTLGGCYWFGGQPRANFYAFLLGSYNTAFRVSEVTDSLRVSMDYADDYWRYDLIPDSAESHRWFSVPLSVGAHTLYVSTVPSFLPAVVSFETTSTDPCNPSIVDIPLINDDLNGDGCVDDADLLMLLFNFGTGC